MPFLPLNQVTAMSIYPRLRQKAFALCFVALILLPTSAFADDSARLDQVERRIDSIESKLDALIQMQTNAQGAKPVPKGAQEDSAAAADGTPPDTLASDLKPGLTLDLYMLKEGGDTLAAAEESNAPAASADIEPNGSSFKLGDFEEIGSMSRFAQPTERQVALLWSGVIKIEREGAHVFQLEITSADFVKYDVCDGSMKLDGQSVVTTKLDRKSRSALESGSVNLAQGFHEFKLYATCSRSPVAGRTTPPDFARLQFGLFIKAPTDRAPKPIDPSLFFIQG
jgi:hypothetical protein